MSKRIVRGIEAAIETIGIFLAALAARDGIYYFAIQNGEVVEDCPPILGVAIPMMMFIIIGICFTGGMVELITVSLLTLVTSVLMMRAVIGSIITPVAQLLKINTPIWAILVVYVLLDIFIILFTARWWNSLCYVVTGE